MVLDPKIPCLRYFEALCAIPHGSGNEAQIAAYLMEFARQHGLWAIQEDCGNVIIKKPASVGYPCIHLLVTHIVLDSCCTEITPVLKAIPDDGYTFFLGGFSSLFHAASS